MTRPTKLRVTSGHWGQVLQPHHPAPFGWKGSAAGSNTEKSLMFCFGFAFLHLESEQPQKTQKSLSGGRKSIREKSIKQNPSEISWPTVSVGYCCLTKHSTLRVIQSILCFRKSLAKWLFCATWCHLDSFSFIHLGAQLGLEWPTQIPSHVWVLHCRDWRAGGWLVSFSSRVGLLVRWLRAPRQQKQKLSAPHMAKPGTGMASLLLPSTGPCKSHGQLRCKGRRNH